MRRSRLYKSVIIDFKKWIDDEGNLGRKECVYSPVTEDDHIHIACGDGHRFIEDIGNNPCIRSDDEFSSIPSGCFLYVYCDKTKTDHGIDFPAGYYLCKKV